MKMIITNNDSLQDKDITEIKKRVKLLLINSKNEILLAYSYHEYQFPGGKNENEESLLDTVNRELYEETGISLCVDEISPFACAKGYYKDWPEVGKNRLIEIYYYEILTDETPNLDQIKLTDNEKNGDFELRYIKLDNLEEELKDNVSKYGDPHNIAKEMLELLAVYKNQR